MKVNLETYFDILGKEALKEAFNRKDGTTTLVSSACFNCKNDICSFRSLDKNGYYITWCEGKK